MPAIRAPSSEIGIVDLVRCRTTTRKSIGRLNVRVDLNDTVDLPFSGIIPVDATTTIQSPPASSENFFGSGPLAAGSPSPGAWERGAGIVRQDNRDQRGIRPEPPKHKFHPDSVFHPHFEILWRDRPPVPFILLFFLSTGSFLMMACSPFPHEVPGREMELAAKAVEVPRRKVVLVHGIFDTRITMRPLHRAIVDGGYECLVPSLRPIDGRKGLEPMAQQLGEIIDAEWKKDTKFSIVAFSMGGLISRYYLQELGGAGRCEGLYTIATPHHGTYMAYLYPGQGTRQMRPESRFLASLRRGEDIYKNLKIPTTSYQNPMDVVMLPLRSPEWRTAENVRLWSAIHPSLLWEKELHADLLRRLRENAN